VFLHVDGVSRLAIELISQGEEVRRFLRVGVAVKLDERLKLRQAEVEVLELLDEVD